MLFCLSRGLALRGNETDKGNFISLIEHSSVEQMPKYKLSDGSYKYTSPDHQNEMIMCIRDEALSIIQQEIDSSFCFSLLVDGGKDITKNEYLAIIIRYVHVSSNKDFKNHQELILKNDLLVSFM
jgi:hypothetical protein